MIFGFLPQNLKTQGGGRGFHYVLARGGGRGGSSGGRGWRGSGASCTARWGCAATRCSRPGDALACRPERVHMLAELCLEPECRRGHGGVYDALNCGEVRIGAAAAGGGRGPAAPVGRRPDPAGVRRVELAAAGRGDQPGAAVLPLLRAREGERADDPRLAVLLGRRRWSRAARRGRCRWTRSGSARPMTPPRSPPPRSAMSSRGSSPPGTGARATRTSSSSWTPATT